MLIIVLIILWNLVGNLKLVAEYFQSSEAFGGPSRDWIGIYEECSK